MKNTKYKTIKQKIGKYVLPIATAGVLTLGANLAKAQSYFPVSREVSNKLKTEQRAYEDSVSRDISTKMVKAYGLSRKNIELAVKSFNEGIVDGNYTLDESKETLLFYNKADSLHNVGKKLSKKINVNYQTVSKDTRKMQRSLDKLVNKIDFGKAEFEKELNEEGYKVKVENPLNEKEEETIGNITASVIYGIPTATILAVFGYGLMKQKRYKK